MTRAAATFGVNTYSYTLSHSARDCLAGLADLGFTTFELMIYPGHLWPADLGPSARRALRQFIESNGLTVTTLNMPNVDLNVAGASAEMRAYTLANLSSVVQLAGDLGIPAVVLGPGKANPLFPAPIERLTGYFYAALDILEPLAHDLDTMLCIENMPFAFLPGIDALLQALDHYGCDRIGVVYDVANGHYINEDIGAALRKCRRRLKVVHLSDTNQQLYRHDPIGLGTVDFAPIPAVLTEIGFTPKPMFEIISTDPDRDIVASASTLLGAGWDRAGH